MVVNLALVGSGFDVTQYFVLVGLLLLAESRSIPKMIAEVGDSNGIKMLVKAG